MEEDQSRRNIEKLRAREEFLEKHIELGRSVSTCSLGHMDKGLDQEKTKRKRDGKISPHATIKRSKVQEVDLGESEMEE